MKIAITFLTFGLDAFGGIERSTFFLATGLADNGCEVVAITSSAFSDGSTVAGIRTIPLTSLPNDFRGADASIYAHFSQHRELISNEIVQILRDESPDYVLAVDPIWGIIPLLSIWKEIRCPIGLIFHVVHPAPILNAVAEMPFAHLFAVSPWLTRELRVITAKLVSKAFTILPNCVRLSEFSDHTALGSTTIFGNARLSKEKGITDLIRAFAILADTQREVILWLCGGDYPFGREEPVKRDLESTIQKLGIDTHRVVFLPRLKWTEIPGRIAASRLVALPSYRESFGMAALEALAAGTPLVVSSAGNLPHLVGDAALVVKPGDIMALASAIRLLMIDSALRERNIEMGRRRASRYDAPVVAADFLGVIGGK